MSTAWGTKVISACRSPTTKEYNWQIIIMSVLPFCYCLAWQKAFTTLVLQTLIHKTITLNQTEFFFTSILFKTQSHCIRTVLQRWVQVAILITVTKFFIPKGRYCEALSNRVVILNYCEEVSDRIVILKIIIPKDHLSKMFFISNNQ